MQRHAVAVDREQEAVAGEAAGLDLQALERAVDVAHGAAGAGFLAQHVPRLERGAQLDVDVAHREIADAREAELEVRVEPRGVERLARHAQVARTSLKSVRLKCGSIQRSWMSVPSGTRPLV